MILADTSVWVDHLRSSDHGLVSNLNKGKVVIHPFIIGEIALGHLIKRKAVLGELEKLPQVPIAPERVVLNMIERVSLYGTGIGYIDAHLLAAVVANNNCLLWTRDKKLRTASVRMNVSAASLQ